MPPIPLHKTAPIAPTAEKPTGITPQTASSQANQQQPPPTHTTPASVPSTTTASAFANNPPAPQPGARPAAPTASSSTPYNNSSPPPPQPGAVPSAGGYTATHTTVETRLAGPPPQYAIPPPTSAQLAGRSTTTSTTPSKPLPPGPTSLNLGPAPPGASPYQQEHSGGAVQSQGRSSLEGPPGYHQTPDNTPYAPLGGSGSGGDGAGEEGVGAAAWNILAKAGEALKKGEEATWKALRNNK